MKYFFISLFFFLTIFVQAQQLENYAEIRHTSFSKAEVNDLFQTVAYPANTFEGLKVGIKNYYFLVAHPFKLGDNISIKAGLEYDIIGLVYENWNSDIAITERPVSLKSLNFYFDVTQKFGKGWQVQLQAKPGIASDWQNDLQGDDFIFQGFGIIGKYFKEDESLFIGLGASQNTLLGEKMLLPVLDFYWKTGKFKFDGTFPFKGGVYFLPTEKLEIGLQGRIQGNRYNLNYADNALSQAVAYSTIFGGLALQWKFYKNFALNTEFGINANRTYEVLNGQDKKVIDTDPKKFESMFWSVGLVWQFKKE